MQEEIEVMNSSREDQVYKRTHYPGEAFSQKERKEVPTSCTELGNPQGTLS